jgi:hypothetical protein
MKPPGQPLPLRFLGAAFAQKKIAGAAISIINYKTKIIKGATEAKKPFK